MPKIIEMNASKKRSAPPGGRGKPAGAHPFKRCSLCGHVWQTAGDFLSDGLLKLDGYQGSLRRLKFGELGRGLLLFTHKRSECGTTLAIEAKRFREEATA